MTIWPWAVNRFTDDYSQQIAARSCLYCENPRAGLEWGSATMLRSTGEERIRLVEVMPKAVRRSISFSRAATEVASTLRMKAWSPVQR